MPAASAGCRRASGLAGGARGRPGGVGAGGRVSDRRGVPAGVRAGVAVQNSSRRARSVRRDELRIAYAA